MRPYCQWQTERNLRCDHNTFLVCFELLLTRLNAEERWWCFFNRSKSVEEMNAFPPTLCKELTENSASLPGWCSTQVSGGRNTFFTIWLSSSDDFRWWRWIISKRNGTFLQFLFSCTGVFRQFSFNFPMHESKSNQAAPPGLEPMSFLMPIRNYTSAQLLHGLYVSLSAICVKLF